MIIITVEGGLVQDILTDDQKLLEEEAIVVDFDTDGYDDTVTTMNGDTCCPSRHRIRPVDAAYVADIVKITKERESL